jgi:hypothetical protein
MLLKQVGVPFLVESWSAVEGPRYMQSQVYGCRFIARWIHTHTSNGACSTTHIFFWKSFLHAGLFVVVYQRPSRLSSYALLAYLLSSSCLLAEW